MAVEIYYGHQTLVLPVTIDRMECQIKDWIFEIEPRAEEALEFRRINIRK